MGLYICYRLALPGDTAVEDVRGKLASLKAFAETLGFDKVAGPTEYTVDQIANPTNRDFVTIMASTLSADPPDFYELPDGSPCAMAFVVVPGEECEPAVLAFLAPGARSDMGGPHDDLHPGEWFWSGACKTQYASIISDEHLIKCHVGLVRLLEHAATLGITVTVDDETGYWEHRSTEKLIQSVRDMNRLVAKVAGALDDRLGEHSVQAPIFEHPEFEHLEMEDFGPADQADGADPKER